MSAFWNNLSSAAQSLRDHQYAAQDAAIAKAAAFQNNLSSAAQSLRDHQYAAQDAKIQSIKDHGLFGALGLDSIGLVPGNTPTEPPTFVPTRPNGVPSPPNSGESAFSGSVAPQTFEYLNADLAKYYGMSKATAYQEAMENTAYQRALKDMQAAGLNPAVMFGSGRAGAAGSSVYASEQSSGGGSYTRRSGGSSGSGKLFDSSVYAAVSTIGGLIGIVATGRPDGYWIGSQITQGAMHLMNAVSER